ncbi:acyl carrier protein [Flavobacterium sp. Arc3]|jgi:acyl carrier protein|uniref:acyl carrier protein n=1 Tax=Flavobacterium sp. Arc3 TaxID=3046686 RepID=UPI00352E7D2A
MKIEEFLEVIKVEFLESGDIVEANTKFRDLDDWDSLTGMSLIVLLEETYSVSIPDDVFSSFTTIEDIYNYILEKK